MLATSERSAAIGWLARTFHLCPDSVALVAAWLMHTQTHQVIAAVFTGALTFAGVLERMWTILRRFTRRDD